VIGVTKDKFFWNRVGKLWGDVIRDYSIRQFDSLKSIQKNRYNCSVLSHSPAPIVVEGMLDRGVHVLMEKRFYVYILASRQNGNLYVGVTSDLLKRV